MAELLKKVRIRMEGEGNLPQVLGQTSTSADRATEALKRTEAAGKKAAHGMQQTGEKVDYTSRRMGVMQGAALKMNQEFDRSTKEANRFSDGLDKMRGSSAFIIGGALAAGVAGLGKKLFDMGLAGEKVIGLEAGFTNLAESLGVDAARAINEAAAATGNLASKADLIQRFNQLALLGVPVTTESFVKLAEASTKLGRAMGIDVGYAFESLAVGLGRQSRLFLDNLGIIVQEEEAYKNAAKAMGKTSDELTEQEKKLAFYNATLAAIDVRLKKLGDVGDAVVGAQRLQVAFKDWIDLIETAIARNMAFQVTVAKWADILGTTFEEPAQKAASDVAGVVAGLGDLEFQAMPVEQLMEVTGVMIKRLRELRTERIDEFLHAENARRAEERKAEAARAEADAIQQLIAAHRELKTISVDLFQSGPAPMFPGEAQPKQLATGPGAAFSFDFEEFEPGPALEAAIPPAWEFQLAMQQAHESAIGLADTIGLMASSDPLSGLIQGLDDYYAMLELVNEGEVSRGQAAAMAVGVTLSALATLFGKQKGLAIAEVVINAAVAIMKAYAQAGPYLGTVFAALITATARKQIMTIRKQDFQGAAEGGFVQHEGIVRVGEGNNPEVIVPLRGSAAARAREELGLGGGGGGLTVNVYAPVSGPVFGEMQRFRAMVTDAVREGVRSGNFDLDVALRKAR